VSLLLAVLVTASVPDPSPSRGSLERLLEAASDDAFYIVLEPAAKRISLRLREVVLLEGEASGIAQATRRVAFWPASGGPGIVDLVWTGGRLLPPRSEQRDEVVPGKGAKAASAPEPSACFDVAFDGGLVLEVRSSEGCPLRTAAMLRWAALRQLWPRSGGEPHARLRVAVPQAFARALYAALADDVRLVVLG